MTSRKLFIVLLSACAFGSLSALTVHATVILDNLTEFTEFGESSSPTDWVAQGFNPGSADYKLSNLTVRTSGFVGGPLTAELWSDSLGEPASLITNLGSASQAGTTTSFPLSNSISANTDYWLVFRYPDTGFQDVTGSLAFTAAGDATLGARLLTSDSGGDWIPVSGRLQLSLSGTAVPEPSTFAMTALGLLSLGFAGWRRRRRGA